MKQRFIKSLLLFASSICLSTAWGQTPLQVSINHTYDNETKTEHYPAISTGDENNPTVVKNASHVEMIGKDAVVMKPGFTTQNLTSGGAYFKASTAPLNPTDFDAVVIAPDPLTNTDANGILNVNKWEKYEVAFKIPDVYETAINSFLNHYYDNSIGGPSVVDLDHEVNPYAGDSIEVRVDFTSPTGKHITKWAFFMKEAEWNTQNYSWDLYTNNTYTYNQPANADKIRLMAEPHSQQLIDLNNFHWHIRFAPDEEGVWTYTVTVKTPYLKYPGGMLPVPDLSYPDVLSPITFICTAPLQNNHGFIRVNQNNHRYLVHDDGTPYFGIGFHYADQWRNNYPVADNVNEVFNEAYPPWTHTFHYFKFDQDVTFDVMDQAASVGVNYMLFPLSKKSFAPEWQHLGYYDKYRSVAVCPPDHVGQIEHEKFEYNYQYGCKLLDQIFDHAHEKNIYLELTQTWNTPLPVWQSAEWDDNAYWRNFVKNAATNPPVQIPDPQNPNFMYWIGSSNNFNMAAFFTSELSNSFNSIYYWKRLYKYIMSRWGYSVNLLAVQPFDEINQTLGDHQIDPSMQVQTKYGKPKSGMCYNIQTGNYLPNHFLKEAIETWITELIGYIKEPVAINANGINTGGLGESHLFNMAYTNLGSLVPLSEKWRIGNQTFAEYYEPLAYDQLDLLSIHSYSSACFFNKYRWDLLNNEIPTIFGGSPTNIYKPACTGEIGAYTDTVFDCIYNGGTQLSATEKKPTKDFYNNYEISFHNNLWSSAFQGGSMVGGEWYKELIFNIPFARISRDFEMGENQLYEDKFGFQKNLPIHTNHHHYKILADFINVGINQLNPVDFNDNLIPYKYYGLDVPPPSPVFNNKVESYYLVSSDKKRAWGWIHNLNHYWANNYIETNYDEVFTTGIPNGHDTDIVHNSIFNDVLLTGIEHDYCTDAIARVTLDGFNCNASSPVTYAIELYKTVDGGGVIPINPTSTTDPIIRNLTNNNSNGTVSFDITLGCDSMNADYGFLIIDQNVPHRMMTQTIVTTVNFDVDVKPVASYGDFNLNFIKAHNEEVTVTVYDLMGKLVFSEKTTSSSLTIKLQDKLAGVYLVNCQSQQGLKTKRIIKL